MTTSNAKTECKNTTSSSEAAIEKDIFIYLAIGGVVLLWVVAAIVILTIPGQLDKGTFGDAFGALNTLFSGLAFAILIATIRLQKTELQLQREEMELQRYEMRQSRSELEGQKQQLAKQNELSVMAARLSVLPLLIRQECDGIASLGPYFEEWSKRNPDSLSAQQAHTKWKQEQVVVAKELERIIASPQSASMQRGIETCQQSIHTFEQACRRAERLEKYLQDMQTIYQALRLQA